MSYNFINKLLNKYYTEIRILDLDQKAILDEIIKFKKNRDIKMKNISSHDPQISPDTNVSYNTLDI